MRLIKQIFSIAIIIAVGVAGIIVHENNNDIPTMTDPLRLHVIANSDDPIDQSIKLKIRDEVIDILSNNITNASSKDVLSI